VSDAIQVNHVPERGRFEAVVEGHVAFTAYKLADHVMTMHHTVVPPEIERRGIAGRLVEAAFEVARSHGYKIDPTCEYVQHYMERHPETASLHV
jgi:hypothetical protein